MSRRNGVAFTSMAAPVAGLADCGGEAGSAATSTESTSLAATAAAMNSVGARLPAPAYESLPQMLSSAVVIRNDNSATPASDTVASAATTDIEGH